MHNIGITGTGSLIGQALIKCILNSKYSKEYKLIGFDYFPETVGSFWCNENYILPDLLKKGMGDIWIEQLIKVIKEEKIVIETTNPSSPGVLKPLGKENYIHVVMPMFVQW